MDIKFNPHHQDVDLEKATNPYSCLTLTFCLNATSAIFLQIALKRVFYYCHQCVGKRKNLGKTPNEMKRLKDQGRKMLPYSTMMIRMTAIP